MKDVTDLNDSPAYQLWLATNAWQRQIRKVLEPLELTHVQFTILAAIFRLSNASPQPVMQVDVCRFGSLDVNMTSEVIRSLERKGFVQRLPHPTDGRARQLALTPTGADLFERARERVIPVARSFFSPLGEHQVELARMLAVVNAHAVRCETAAEDSEDL